MTQRLDSKRRSSRRGLGPCWRPVAIRAVVRLWLAVCLTANRQNRCCPQAALAAPRVVQPAQPGSRSPPLSSRRYPPLPHRDCQPGHRPTCRSLGRTARRLDWLFRSSYTVPSRGNRDLALPILTRQRRGEPSPKSGIPAPRPKIFPRTCIRDAAWGCLQRVIRCAKTSIPT